MGASWSTKQKQQHGESYHGGLGPVGIQRFQLAPDLMRYLQGTAEARASEKDLPQLGFERCCDSPSRPGHVYYEGYFHTLPVRTPVTSVHPRHGDDFDKPACSIRFAAFAEAFRRVNRQTICEWGLAAGRDSVLYQVLRDSKAFGDLAIQVHCGQSVDEDALAWHTDAANSIAHMAVSLRGQRTLCSKLGATEASVKGSVDVLQQAGDVYVSNPVSYVHAVSYPQSDWDSRIIACQFRLLMTEKEMYSPEAMKGGEKVACGLVLDALRMPSLQEVLDIEQLLDKL